MKNKVIHLGIDWEDFSLIFYDKGLIEDFKIFSNEFINETYYLLNFLNKESIKCTFFCNARTAEIYPELIREINKNGHQIGSHGYLHVRRDELNDKDFLQDCIKSKTILENIINKDIEGYRSPYLSFTQENYIKSLKLLYQAGYKFDSSVTFSFFKKIKYQHPKEILKIQEFISIKKLFSIDILGNGINLAGGSIWRVVPSKIIKFLVKFSKSKNSLSLYFHPYEFGSRLNPQRALGKEASKLKLFLCFLRWNLGRKKIEKLISRLNNLNSVKFNIY